MAVRAERAEATKERILEAARSLFSFPSPGFTLERVAEIAGTSVQTVLRAFGSKDALLVAAVGSERRSQRVIPASGNPRAVVNLLFDDYEEIGPRVVNILAEEHRVPDLGRVAKIGRDEHRAWVERAFAPHLEPIRGAARRKVVLALVSATDIYVWKLLRLDLGLERIESEAVVRHLVAGALGLPPKES